MNVKLSHLSALLITALVMILSGCADRSVKIYEANVPLYQPFSEWRATSFSVTAPQEMAHPGKIYIKDQYLFVNEFLKGIHIYDNTDPSNPVNLGFLEILANVDMAVKFNQLYVDSYTDLLVFDISDPAHPEFTERVEDVFDFNAYGYYDSYDHNYPISQVDESQGVVVGWKVEKVTEEVLYANYWGGMWLEDATLDFADAGGGSGSNLQGAGTGGSMARFTLYDEFLYMLDNSELEIFNITGTPESVQTLSLAGWNPETLFPNGNRLFVGTRNGMLVYDLTSPGSPTYITEFIHVRACDPVVVDGDIAYVTLATGRNCGGIVNELQLVDVSDITAPSLMFAYEMFNPKGLGTDGDLLFICDGSAGLKVYDKSVSAAIPSNQLFIDASVGATYDVIPNHGTLIMTSDAGIYQYDYTDPAAITQLSLIPVIN